ncbi:hypothetical protein CB1_000390033 [Camelus ferus]|nr:hypothetical protein CB1_000390033 [Camelus ferus]
MGAVLEGSQNGGLMLATWQRLRGRCSSGAAEAKDSNSSDAGLDVNRDASASSDVPQGLARSLGPTTPTVVLLTCSLGNLPCAMGTFAIPPGFAGQEAGEQGLEEESGDQQL